MLDRLKHLTRGRRREPLTGAVEAVLADCREIIAAVAALDGLPLGPDDQAVAGKATAAASEGVSAAYAWGDHHTRGALNRRPRSTTVNAKQRSRRRPKRRSPTADVSHADPPTRRRKHCANITSTPSADICEASQTEAPTRTPRSATIPKWRAQLRFLVDDRTEIASRLDAVLRINDRLSRTATS